MKKIILKQAIIACMIVSGFTNCTREGEQLDGVARAEETTMKLNISLQEPTTRAPQDQNATDNEVKVSTIDIFIFDANTRKIENRISLNAQEIDENPTKDAFTTTTEIRTTTGPKLVAAGINLPNDFPEVIMSADLQKAWDVSSVALNSANGLVMFSTRFQTPTLVTRNDADYATRNSIDIPVERAVAKIAVQDGGYTATLPSGTISNVSFAIRNSNTRLFPMQVVDNGIIKDPNWAKDYTYSPSDFKHFNDYASINDKTNTDKRSWNTKYAPENTAEIPLEKTSTYASIRVKFTPTRYTNGQGKEKVNLNSTDFWVVMYDDVVYYFDDKVEAQTFAAARGATVSEQYKDGHAYYNAFINVKNGCNVLRNSFYNVKISLIIPPGSPTPEEENPDDKVKEATDIKVSIDLEAWDYQEDAYPLS
ncbi:MAG: Mfa1 family fimbria major subunit [Odoribacteraceae bacterium]|jgi:hypothetical protein|nr:Mfa1 family fimbria major subunit [Odoribacteraceae bacterium]